MAANVKTDVTVCDWGNTMANQEMQAAALPRVWIEWLDENNDQQESCGFLAQIDYVGLRFVLIGLHNVDGQYMHLEQSVLFNQFTSGCYLESGNPLTILGL